MAQEEVYTNSVKCQELAKNVQKLTLNLKLYMKNGKSWPNKPAHFSTLQKHV